MDFAVPIGGGADVKAKLKFEEAKEMFTILKVLTKSGRQQLAREALREYCTPDEIAKLCASGAAYALEAGAERLTDERCAQIASGCKATALALTHVTEAIDPNGDGGKKVTEAEKQTICADIRTGVGLLVTQEQLDKFADKIVERVP